MKLYYRKLKKHYRYVLHKYWSASIPELKDADVKFPLFRILLGRLYVHAGYAWDGASGPVFQTRDFVLPTLVHDILYQSMREGLLDSEIWKPIADKLLYKMCMESGMPKWRARYVYAAVRMFGPKYEGKPEPPEILEIEEC